eukprot:TRINITY_DN11819_c0_g1_i1.p1 TRINITY_DN11819_c0_g1~~TRINITY_DN11819_c0_g1_i1.p1  ORF type:complete len:194 (-),score=31.47 TRINITY_DN11819_c0_g1_i1:404-985(-)
MCIRDRPMEPLPVMKSQRSFLEDREAKRRKSETTTPTAMDPAMDPTARPLPDGITAAHVAELQAVAKTCLQNAYCPYSNFSVGAAVLAENGQVFGGCNVENACYGLTLCAERVALSNMCSAGQTKPRALLCMTKLTELKWACGACLSFVLEFGEEIVMFSSNYNMDRVGWRTVREQMPYAFSKATLESATAQQ